MIDKPETAAILSDLAHAKAVFQLRAVVAVMGLRPDQCGAPAEMVLPVERGA